MNMPRTVNAKTYAVAGIGLFGIKFLLDRMVAINVFHRSWSLFDYLDPFGPARTLLTLDLRARSFAAAMLAIALPFIAVGVALTLKRLRSAALPWWLVSLFFVPVVNLAVFALLCVFPERAVPAPTPQISRQSFVFTLVVCSIGLLFVLGLSLGWVPGYGWGLFVGTPFTLSLMAVLTYSSRQPRSFGSCVAVGCGAPLLAASALLLTGVEGVVCLLMAAPLVAAIGFMGASVGYSIQNGIYGRREIVAVAVVLIAFPPSMMAAEAGLPAPLFEVRSSVDINASPSWVWKNVIAFEQLPEPRELLFKAGIAYPIRAEIRGKGPGAVRYCVFSTGPFVEPITVWDEPRLLRFGVASSPNPMQELSPYSGIRPRHLDSYLVSRQGQFLLTPLPDGRTRLEGTTWYQHHMWPAGYWQLWSDYIIHRIHMRVLEHIKRLSEAG